MSWHARRNGRHRAKASHFVRDYEASVIHRKDVDRFLGDMEQVVEMLNDRINYEERLLYVMYQSPEPTQAGQ